MKKSWIIIGIIIIALVILFRLFVSPYNNMVKMEEGVTSQWAQVENVYQRRADLIPNLVNTVKGYATFEKETLTQVIEARSKATQVTINPEKLTPEALQQFQQAQGGLSSALSRLMVVVERYPELKANQNFLMLQEELAGIESKIAYARQFYNDMVLDYNNRTQMMPDSIIAGMFGFGRREFFQTQEAERANVKVQF